MPKPIDLHNPDEGIELADDAFRPPSSGGDTAAELELDWDAVDAARAARTEAAQARRGLPPVPTILDRAEHADAAAAGAVFAAGGALTYLVGLLRLLAAIPLSLLPRRTQDRVGVGRLPMRWGTMLSVIIVGVAVFWVGGHLYHAYQDALWEPLSKLYLESSNPNKRGVAMATGMSHFLGFLFLTPAGLILFWTFVEQLVRFAAASVDQRVGTTSLWIVEELVVRIGRAFGWIDAPAATARDRSDVRPLRHLVKEAAETVAAHIAAMPASMLPRVARTRWDLDAKLPLTAGATMSSVLTVLAGGFFFYGPSVGLGAVLMTEGLVRFYASFASNIVLPSLLGVPAYLLGLLGATAR